MKDNTTLKVNTKPEVKSVFDAYPDNVRNKILALRELVISTAKELEDVAELEETLKWGEPSYIAKNGSTLRIDWKRKKPSQYAMYFKCTSKLVPTFKKVYGNLFEFEGDRAIVFSFDQKIPKKALKSCIKSALLYHKIKNLPDLGMS